MKSTQYTATAVAKAVPFNNKTNGFVATNVQAAIEEISAAPKIAMDLPPGITTIVDTRVAATMGTVEYTVALTYLGKVKQFKMMVSYSSVSGEITQIYAKGGDKIDVRADAVLNGLAIEVRFYNAEPGVVRFLSAIINT